VSVPPPAPVRRGPVVAIAIIGLAWVGLLAWFVFAWFVLQSANPVVVNRVQVQHADVIVQGLWQADSPPRLTVERTWKAKLDAQSVRVRQPEGISPSGRVIVPLTRISPDLYEVTHGELANLPEHGLPPQDAETVISLVRPQAYPDTGDVIRQIEALLSQPDIR
jgi:hypothetical protein